MGGKVSKKRPESSADKLLPPASPTTPTTPKEIPLLENPPVTTMEETLAPKVYKRRWVMLLLFVAYSFSNAYQWIHLNIIGNVIIEFYNESLPTDSFQQATAIDWLSMIYMLCYIPLIFPATWLLDKKGLRISLICGAFLNALGAWIKCACLASGRFPVLMFAQTICAIAQIFILGIPAQLAATWFGPDQVSTATSIGVFGNQVGCAAGFLIPPLLVPNSDDRDVIGSDLGKMFYIWAGLTTALFIAIIVVFKEKPPRPPSKAQMLAAASGTQANYFDSLKNLFRNRGFILLTITYGINTGCYYGIGTLLNPIILHYFPGQEQSAGQIGLVLVLAGVVGSVVGGILLDRTKAFKATTVGIYLLSMAGMVAFTFTLGLNLIWVVFLTAGILGFFMTGYLPVGFEFAAEITYPEPEGTSSGLLNAAAQVFGILLTIGMRALVERVSVQSANITVSVMLLVGTIVTGFISADYRRQEAGKRAISYLDDVRFDINTEDKDTDKVV
ncbi:feline leukemia virus subgroup C receptor-related protein 2-like isoform X3 [Dreissena polymorpha]|uniref:feline leukemia virus subgroup C receptor-related protein 2-like isoform X2 n=1 Tax=Dreissena polymorpha TaxID=45954 RepID=UPI002263EDF4|nr:feline leukemia virus subgroup C receptor-related protein 2-like isoform X2 [Dreissena polymorpha]XP_052241721.1 feline leukemia virus subgroup C receptor-related protein 2-like isoform X3 [Dreissena polymorpha]